jgi:hypothetical protein
MGWSRVLTASVVAVLIWLSGCSSTAPVTSDGDLLRALHEKVIHAHRQNNVDLLLEDEAADYVVAGRGEVTRPSLDERRQRLGEYFRAATFEEYRDIADPVITVSSDGTLGWVIVQVHARGVRAGEGGRKEALDFVSAWIELYQKRDGRWWRVGNVSNFRS